LPNWRRTIARSGQTVEATTRVEFRGTELNGVRVSGVYQPPEPDVGISRAIFEDVEVMWADGTKMPVELQGEIEAANEEAIQEALDLEA